MIEDGRKEVTWFINPRRDRTTLTKPGTSKNESIYFFHPYLDFWLSQSGFARPVNFHGIQIPLQDFDMKMDRIPVCSIKSSQMMHVWDKIYGM